MIATERPRRPLRVAGWARHVDRAVVRGVLRGLAIGLVVLLALPSTRALLWPPAPVPMPAPAAVVEPATATAVTSAIGIAPAPLPTTTTTAAATTVALRATVTAPAASPTAPARRLDLADAVVSADARRVAEWVVASADNGNRHFAIVDKRAAQVLLFEPGGRLAGATPVLLGYAAGDHTVPGIGKRPIAQIRPDERTTPAGRFVAQSGKNANGEDVVWVDYESAVSMHRVRATNPAERRLERLASPTVADNRISYGCINVPVAFFEQTLWPAMGKRRGIVYVLPERKALADVFPGVATIAVAQR